MKHTEFVVVALAAALVAGCSLGELGTGGVPVLPNGKVLTRAEVESIRQLDGEAEAIIAQAGDTDPAAMAQRLESLLKERLGDSAGEYYGESSEVLAGPESRGARAIVGTIGTGRYTGVPIYYSIVAHYNWGPWWCYHWVMAELTYANGSIFELTAGFGGDLQDEVTNGSMYFNRATDSSTGIPQRSTVVREEVECLTGQPEFNGYTKYGFFPSMSTLRFRFRFDSRDIPGGRYQTPYYTSSH